MRDSTATTSVGLILTQNCFRKVKEKGKTNTMTKRKKFSFENLLELTKCLCFYCFATKYDLTAKKKENLTTMEIISYLCQFNQPLFRYFVGFYGLKMIRAFLNNCYLKCLDEDTNDGSIMQ